MARSTENSKRRPSSKVRLRLYLLRPGWLAGPGGGQLHRFQRAGDAPAARPQRLQLEGDTRPLWPAGSEGETMTLYHNDGHGHFTDVTKQAGVETPREYYGFTVLTGDFDSDGWPDFYVTCDSTLSLYFRNKRNGTFEELGLTTGLAVNEDAREQAGMGATAADYDGDGFLDRKRGG